MTMIYAVSWRLDVRRVGVRARNSAQYLADVLHAAEAARMEDEAGSSVGHPFTAFGVQ